MRDGRMLCRVVVTLVLGATMIAVLLWRFMRSDEWHPDTVETPYIPRAALMPDMAVLDLTSVLVFELTNGYGYVYFTEVNKTDASYICVVHSWSCGASGKTCANGKVRLIIQRERNTADMIVMCGSLRLHWLPPTSLFFDEDMRRVALIPVEELPALRQGVTNVLSWIDVNIPPA